MARSIRRGPLDPAPATQEAAIARRLHGWREGMPSAAFLLGWAAVILVAGVAVGLFLTDVASHDALGRTDVRVSRWFLAHRTAGGRSLTHWVTDLAQTQTIAVLAVVTVALAALRWRRWREPLLVAVAVAGEVAIFLAITFLVHRNRPPVSHLDPAPPTSSFPSGHVAAAIAMYGSLAVLAYQRARSALLRGLSLLLAVAVPVAVGVARVYRGMHFASDVIGGALLGAAWLAVTVRGMRLGVLHQQLRVRRRTRLRAGPGWLARHG